MCLHPIHAHLSFGLNKNGKQSVILGLAQPPHDPFDNYIPLPCGKCAGCIEDRRNRWVSRMLLEYDDCGCGSFVTLTYNDEHLPPKPSKHDVQCFLKRFRHLARDYGIPLHNFRYFIAAERGSKKGRPHYHGIFFGVDFMQPAFRPYIALMKDGYPVYSSEVLGEIWRQGFVSFDSISSRSIRYVSKYISKQDGQDDCFTLKSMRIGVSSLYNCIKEGRKTRYEYRYKDSLNQLINGTVHVSDNGKPLAVRIPPAICKYAERIDPFDYDTIKMCRAEDAIRFQRNFDKAAYVERLKDKNQKEKRKRVLHND